MWTVRLSWKNAQGLSTPRDLDQRDPTAKLFEVPVVPSRGDVIDQGGRSGIVDAVFWNWDEQNVTVSVRPGH